MTQKNFLFLSIDDSNDWTGGLGGYSGTVHIRFRLGTDNSVNDVGWWIDDVQVYGSTWNTIATVLGTFHI